MQEKYQKQVPIRRYCIGSNVKGTHLYLSV